ncbi:alcohol oxidase [Coprinopsis marcescibilis]|uniref:pyranose dehydrogenase (acceptor) n=1 Tax=Coprinopsis marcescibilis TaxID=230819 RepID=A0A5C3KS34_COPMA|nr:alcohol oxidase [Coprinopsis marcescibilis]
MQLRFKALLAYVSLCSVTSVLGQGFDPATTYDYVVIGGGTAGLAVASRLAENQQMKVLVLEAGGNAENNPSVFIPGFIGRDSTLNWAYQTVPQPNLNGRTLTIGAGKGLGGSTLINGMIFPRAEKVQYDAWSAINNNSAFWTWDAVLPYFKKSELFIPPSPVQVGQGHIRFDTSVHGLAGENTEGRIKVGFPNFFFPQSNMWAEGAVANQGLAPSQDLADGNVLKQVGVAPNSLDARNNTRCSSACAYYTPFQNQANLVVLTNAGGRRIGWAARASPTDPLVATSVEFIDASGNTQVAKVGREVILSAGTLRSPQIMELSGVGNTTILNAAGVTPVLDLPTVGENFADHVHSWVNAFTNATTTKDVLLQNSTFSDEQVALWNANRTGFYSAAPRTLSIVAPSTVLNSTQISSLVSRAKKNLQHYATIYSNGNQDLQKGIVAQHQIMLDLYEKDQSGLLEINVEPGYSGPTPFANRPPLANFTTVNTVLYQPFARGRIHIRTNVPTDVPLIDPAYWSHPLDVAGHVAGMQLGRKQLRSPPLSTIFKGEFEPGVDETDAAVEGWGRANVASDNHVTGTLAMLPKELGGVVDEKLRVYGVANVRVADASIVPIPISAHTSSSVYMIGERAADFIKEAWN